MSVQTLIAQSKNRQTFSLTGKALADLRTVLRSNDRESNRLRRVTALQFLTHLKTAYGVSVGRQTFDLYVASLGRRSWGVR